MSVNSKMTAIADEIRTLSGETGIMGLDDMASNIAAANNEVDSQANLIAQIVTALEGKAGGENTTNESVKPKIAYTCHQYNYYCRNIVFEEGWTWEDYYDSEYNIIYDASNNKSNYLTIVEDKYVVYGNNVLWYVSMDGTSSGRVLKTDMIIESTKYKIYDDD